MLRRCLDPVGCLLLPDLTHRKFILHLVISLKSANIWEGQRQVGKDVCYIQIYRAFSEYQTMQFIILRT